MSKLIWWFRQSICLKMFLYEICNVWLAWNKVLKNKPDHGCGTFILPNIHRRLLNNYLDANICEIIIDANICEITDATFREITDANICKITDANICKITDANICEITDANICEITDANICEIITDANCNLAVSTIRESYSPPTTTN